jgi:HEPN domain-containing protein
MDKDEELKQWFSKADDDLKSTEYLATVRPEGIIYFHCQQSAEKYLKGYLFQIIIWPESIHHNMRRSDCINNYYIEE